MAKRNTNSWEGQRPRCPQPQPETTQNAKIKLSAKTAQYRNQISTLLGVSPLNVHFASCAKLCLTNQHLHVAYEWLFMV